MPGCVAIRSAISPCSPVSANVFMSPSSAALNGCVSFHSGCCGANAFTRSSAKASWVYIGCSTHNVPSLSKVAMRSAGGTKSGEPSRVTAATKSSIDCFVAPSFHEGSGLAVVAACADAASG